MVKPGTKPEKRRIAAPGGAPVLLAALFACSDEGARIDAPAAPDRASKLLIIGQDLSAIRGYVDSGCCPAPDGLTAYVDFYDVLKPGDFGGLGLDAAGKPIDLELDWNAGPVSAYKTATEFGIDDIAIGLSITENEHPGKLARLVDGEFDDEIRQLARMFALVEGTVYLRIGYEFDGAWNQGYEDADKYKAAFRRITEVLRAEGADNVRYVWQAGAAVADEVLDGRHEDIRQWYPGDDYVDWMAFSWFMNPQETIQIEAPAYVPPTPLELAQELLAFARERGKPVMIAEASPQAIDLQRNFMADHAPIWDGPAGGNRVAMTDDEIWSHWFQPLFDLMQENDDLIHALAYINANWDAQKMWGPPYTSGFWGDSRLQANGAIAARFTQAIGAWRRPQ